MCTIIKMKNGNGYMLGKNNDTFFPDGIVFTNKRGIGKSALVTPPGTPLQWVSRYGSVSFSQCGKELPVGGMNEAGLVVEQATLPETVYPQGKGQPGVGELQLIQVLLDTCATVEEALHMVKQVEISQPTWTIHYVLADKSGDMAVLEYLDGKVVCIKHLPVAALTNSPYEKSLVMADQIKAGLKLGNQYAQNSLERFCLAEEILASPSFDPDSAFAALEKLERPDTVWNIVYQPEHSMVMFKIKGFGEITSLNLSSIDFRDKAPALMLPLTGNTGSDLIPYSRAQNAALVNAFFKNDILASVMNLAVPDELLGYLAMYPEVMEGGI